MVLVPALLHAAAVLLLAAYLFLVVPRAFLLPCPEGAEDHGGSTPAPSPAAGGGRDDDVVCLRVPLAVAYAITGVVSYLVGSATASFYDWLVDSEDEEEASGAAKKAGYVAIADDDPEAGTSAGGKN